MTRLNNSPPPPRQKNEDVREREYFTPDEVTRLQNEALKFGRYPLRDSTMIMLAFGHGLRVSELVSAMWDRSETDEAARKVTTRINLKDETIYIRRSKGSRSGEHDLRKCEVTSLKKLVKEMKNRDEDYEQRGHVFVNERGGPMSSSSFHKIVARAGRDAGFSFPAHPHQLRHACGFKMINDGIDVRKVQVWMGHRNIQHTVRYTEVDPKQLKGLWKD
jgi:site-specific recombinase XerD